MNIEDILNNLNESSEIEFKVDLDSEKKHYKNWLKTVSAFANSGGGTIIWGITDDTRQLIGISDPVKKSEAITEAINAKIKPYPPYKIKVVKHDGNDFIIVDVDSGVDTPYYLWTESTKEVYIRKGLSTVKVEDPLELNNLISNGKNQAWDAQISKVKLTEASFKDLGMASKRYAKKELIKEDYEPLGLATIDGYLTNAGRLFSDEGIDYSQVFCTRWRGLTMMEAIDSKDFSGSLVSLLDQAEAFVKTHTNQSWKIEDTFNRKTTTEYPTAAVREAIINGLAHRSYMITGSEVHIDIFDDRLEVWSPGGMPDKGIIQQLDIYNLGSVRRNKVVCSVFNNMEFMERRGSGLKRIYEAYDAFDMKPEFNSNDTSFKVVFPSQMYGLENTLTSDSVNGSLNDSVNSEDQILKLIKSNNNITREDLSNELNLSIRTVDRYIKKLKEDGYIERVGSDKAGHWKILK